MKRRPRGQGLIAALLVLPFLIGATALGLREGITAYEKVRLQKEVDQAMLSLAVDHARALNVIAALNRGLVVARQRLQLMNAVIAGLTACAPLNPICGKTLLRLSPKVEPFYRRVRKLGAALARAQENVRQWANGQKRVTLSYFSWRTPRTRLFPYGPGDRTDALPLRRKAETLAGPLAWVPSPLEWIPGADTQIGMAATRPSDANRQALGSWRSPPSDAWSLAEARVTGRDLQRMQFGARLAPASLYREQWRELSVDPAARARRVPDARTFDASR